MGVSVHTFYNQYECCVLHYGVQTEWFPVTSGFRQGCIISSLQNNIIEEFKYLGSRLSKLMGQQSQNKQG